MISSSIIWNDITRYFLQFFVLFCEEENDGDDDYAEIQLDSHGDGKKRQERKYTYLHNTSNQVHIMCIYK